MTTAHEPTPESVWAFMQETDRQIQETARQMKETDRKMQESARETDRRMKESAQETDRKIQETAQQMKESARETNRRLKKAENLFTSQWGRLVESLVEGALVPLFQEQKISVQRTLRRVKGRYEEQNYEFDILVINGNEVVIVEVKTTLRPDDITKFLEKLDRCKVWMPEYASKRIYGAVAFLQADSGADARADKNRLFVIRATGDSAAIVNRKGFEPRSW